MQDKLSVMTEQQSQNLLLKVDPLSTIRNNKFIPQDHDNEGESFCIEYIISLGSNNKKMGFRIFLYCTWVDCKCSKKI